MKFFDYGKHDLEGFTQAGDTHGKYFGSWSRGHVVIYFGDETKRYWLQIGGCIHGSFNTPESAAEEALLLNYNS